MHITQIPKSGAILGYTANESRVDTGGCVRVAYIPAGFRYEYRSSKILVPIGLSLPFSYLLPLPHEENYG
jgi:hypothetical protein